MSKLVLLVLQHLSGLTERDMLRDFAPTSPLLCELFPSMEQLLRSVNSTPAALPWTFLDGTSASLPPL
jgi:hypothetical protein